MATPTRPYFDRLADQLVSELFAAFSALLIVGPRAVGKTTSAARHAVSTLRLDRPAEAAAVRADPDAVLRALPEPILIDEWHLAPEVLGAVKRAVDTDPRPGRFLVTGSVHADLESQTWPGTGRLLRVDLAGLTVRELSREDLNRPTFVDQLVAGTPLRVPEDTPDLADYLSVALHGGFPEPALATSHRVRRLWARSYLEQLFTRDVDQVGSPREPQKLRRYFDAYALNTAGVVTDATLFEAAGLDRRTAESYEGMLRNLFVVESIPAWHNNRLHRLVKLPKRQVLDPLLVAGALGLTVDSVLRQGDLLGRLLDTFVYTQLRPEFALGEVDVRPFHLRDRNGEREVDLVLELDAHRVIGIEIKASAAPRPADARHLAWLRDQLGEKFVHGVVLHTGPRIFPLGERITAAPISSIWA